MDAFLKWLRVQLLRLRSFDWGPGTRSARWLKEGAVTFSSFYRIADLQKMVGSEDGVLRAFENPTVVAELEENGFNVSYKDDTIILSWLEAGISEWKTEFRQDYSEEDGKFYVKWRRVERIIYLDGNERTVSDSGEPKPTPISRDEYDAAAAKMRRESAG